MKEWSGGPSISNQNELIKVIEKLYKKSAPFRKKLDAWLKDAGAGAGAALREDEAAAEREMGWDNQTQETDYAKRQHESVDNNEKRKWMDKAKEESKKEGVTVHLNFDGKNYEISDWYDSDETIASFDNGRRFNESVNKSGKISLKKLVVNENSSGADFGIYDDLEDLLDIVKRSIKLADKTQFSDREAKIILDLATSIYNQTNE